MWSSGIFSMCLYIFAVCPSISANKPRAACLLRPTPPPALLISAPLQSHPAPKSRKAYFYTCGQEKPRKQAQMMRKIVTTNSHSYNFPPSLRFQGRTFLA